MELINAIATWAWIGLLVVGLAGWVVSTMRKAKRGEF